jgi:hypothetical protein
MYSKLGGAFVGQAQAQKPDESKQDFLKRLQRVAAKLMPHESLWTHGCMSVELVEPHKALLAWQADKAKALLKAKCDAWYDESTHALVISCTFCESCVPPEVSVYDVKSCHVYMRRGIDEDDCQVEHILNLEPLCAMALTKLVVSSATINLIPSTLQELVLERSLLLDVGMLPRWLSRLYVEDETQLASLTFTDFMSALERLTRLKHLTLIRTSLTGSLPNKVPSKLSELVIKHHNTQGATIPLGLGNSRLTVLILSHNQLSGCIPPCLFGPGLEYLDLSHNQLSGVLPSVFHDRSRLQHLLLNDNKLNGRLPDCLFDVALLQLNTSNNNFSSN